MICHFETWYRFITDELGQTSLFDMIHTAWLQSNRRYIVLFSKWFHSDYLQISLWLMMGETSFRNEACSLFEMRMALFSWWGWFSLQDEDDFSFEMTRDFLPSVASQKDNHFFCHKGRKICTVCLHNLQEKIIDKKTVHFWQGKRLSKSKSFAKKLSKLYHFWRTVNF